MIEGATVLVVGVLGVLVGLAAGLAFRFNQREKHDSTPPPTKVEPALDEGVTAVLAVLRSGAIVTTVSGEVVRASAAAHAYGLVRGDRLMHQAVRRLLREVARNGEIREAELELPRGPVGVGTVLLRLRAAPLGIDRLLLLAEDWTEARRVEAIRRDFAMNASHELKTPVGALALLAEAVGEAADDPEAVRRFASRIRTEAQRLSALVQDILELSRVQVGDALRTPAPVLIDDALGEAVDRVSTAAAAKGITIAVGGEAGTKVWGDHGLLVTAIRNLLDNAIAYSDAGTQVGVGTTTRADAGIVEIAVVDQGIGIPAEAHTRIFERFYRVDPARSRDTGGTGLGLSIVKHVAADHGGDVTVWSRPGQGSTFTLRLPMAPPPETGGPR